MHCVDESYAPANLIGVLLDSDQVTVELIWDVMQEVWRSSWPFHSFQTVILLEILLNNPSSVRSCIIIHQNEVVTNSSSIWADIWIKDLIPISKTSYGSSMRNTCRSVWPPSEIPAQTRIPPPL
ncbi:uncharacterized protein TNCV_1040581 [Trichonephila clavipes]|nr:uncharacterized protein TNCV_1040581 [Trichonephila clavipes]